MTDKAIKLLRRLPARPRDLILTAINRLRAGNDSGLDVKPLKGHGDVYRARIGNYRIIFRRKDGMYQQITITKRDDQTYRDF